MPPRILFIMAFAMVLISVPAAAQDSAQVPEGSSATLFALGLLGLIIGRRVASKSRKDDPDDR